MNNEAYLSTPPPTTHYIPYRFPNTENKYVSGGNYHLYSGKSYYDRVDVQDGYCLQPLPLYNSGDIVNYGGAIFRPEPIPIDWKYQEGDHRPLIHKSNDPSNTQRKWGNHNHPAMIMTRNGVQYFVCSGLTL